MASGAAAIDLKDFHGKIQQLFRGRESKLRMIDDWVLMETLGMGGYSKVKLGLHKSTGQKAALKIMFADQNGEMSPGKKKQLMRELNVMKKVSHPNVIKLFSYNADAKYPEANGKATSCIVSALEFAAGGELFDYLMYTGHFDDIATRSYFKQLMSGLTAMHTAGIAHRDLKPENLLMDSSFTLKIADFGFATEFRDAQGQSTLMKTPCGTKNYLAPEFWKGQQYSYKCDIFAAGIILFTTYAGFPPFMEAHRNDWWWDKYSIALDKIRRANQLRELIKANPALDTPDSAETKEMHASVRDAQKRMTLFWKAHSKKRKFDDEDFKDLALNMVHPNPAKRKDIQQIMQHKWVTKGAVYNAQQLKKYLTKRVKIVLQGRARKIRKMMMVQKEKMQSTVRAGGGTEGAVRKRMKEIDPGHVFDANLQSVRDDVFPNSLFQFFTKASAAEIAVRIEAAAIKFGADIDISATNALITVSIGFAKDVTMADESKESLKEKVTFCVKVFLLEPLPDGVEASELWDRDDISYLVSFKRLQGRFNPYSKIVTNFFQYPDVAEVMEWDGIEDEEVANDDEKVSDE